MRNSRGDPAVRPTVVALRREGTRRLIQNSASTDARGRFVIAPVPAAEYRLGVMNLSGQPAVPHEFARATVVVRDADVSGLRIVTQPGITLSGVVRYEPQPSQPVTANLSLLPADRFAATYGIQSARTITGTAFEFADVFAPALIRATAPGWTLEAVRLDGRDITDMPVEFTAKDSGRIQVVMTSAAPSIEGTVTDTAGQLVRDCIVVLFGHDRTAWISRSSVLRFAAPLPDGHFRIDGLRTGRYFAVAVPRDQAPDPVNPDPQSFEALTAGAVSITLGAGERHAVALTLAGTAIRP